MKKLFFGVAVVAIAISASAFTNARNTVDTLAQTSPGVYVPVDYADGSCKNDTVLPCAYNITPAGLTAGLQNSPGISAAQVQIYLTQATPFLTMRTSTNKIFVQNP